MKQKLENIAYHLTSTKTKPNKFMRESIIPFFLEKDVKYVLDFGCGKYMRDSLFLAKEGMVVDAVDLEEQIARMDLSRLKELNTLSTGIVGRNYDAALLNFVLQVLPTEEQRKDIMERVSGAVKDDGYLVVSLRSHRDVDRYGKTKGIPFNDGYLMKKGKKQTFVRGYSREEIEELIPSFGLSIVKLHCSCDTYIALSQKT
jgi:2-polyprenyl-3-methyl-5-hydroxy-6-metoxy-1,4-benzoquinol methylase